MKTTSYTVRFYFTQEDFCDLIIDSEHIVSAIQEALRTIAEAKGELLVIPIELPDGSGGGRILRLANVTYVDVFPNPDSDKKPSRNWSIPNHSA